MRTNRSLQYHETCIQSPIADPKVKSLTKPQFGIILYTWIHISVVRAEASTVLNGNRFKTKVALDPPLPSFGPSSPQRSHSLLQANMAAEAMKYFIEPQRDH